MPDFERALTLTEESDLLPFRRMRDLCFARVDPANAVADVEEQCRDEHTAPEALFHAAAVHAVASAHVANENLQEAYAVRATALLEAAKNAGFFTIQLGSNNCKRTPISDRSRSGPNSSAFLQPLKRRLAGK